MSIEKADSRIELYSRELLITLDYLANKTNEKKPASRIAICNYADEVYGLKYDKNQDKGNKIDRRRVTQYLDFLYDMSNEHPDEFPFVIEKTQGGKFYLDQKNSMDESFLIKLLSYIRNDKNIAKDDEDYFFDKLLDAFSAKINHEKVLKEVEANDRKIIKNSLSLEKKTRIFYEALNEGKTVNYVLEINDYKRNVTVSYKGQYRVCMIKEYNHKPYAFLLPINVKHPVSRKNGETIKFNTNYVFDYIENIKIEGRLIDDEPRDLDELFKKSNPTIYKKYGSLQNFIDKAKSPLHGDYNIKVSFCFNYNLLKFIKPIYESMFNEKLNYDTCDGKDIKINRNEILLDSKYCVVKNMIVNSLSFMSFLLTDVHGNGMVSVADMVFIIEPKWINVRLEDYYKKLYEKFKQMNDDDRKEIKEKSNKK